MEDKNIATQLEEIRNALKEADNLRLRKELGDEAKFLLEDSAYSLRKAERLAIAKLQKEILSDMKDLSSELETKAREIRARVSKMNKTTKGLDYIETFLKSVTKILSAIVKLR